MACRLLTVEEVHQQIIGKMTKIASKHGMSFEDFARVLYDSHPMSGFVPANKDQGVKQHEMGSSEP